MMEAPSGTLKTRRPQPSPAPWSPWYCWKRRRCLALPRPRDSPGRDVVGEIHGRFGLGEPWELEDGDDNSDGDDKKGMGDDGDNLNH